MFKKTLLALILSSGVAGFASAAVTTFFGEDRGLGENTPLASHPNSDAARSAFFAHLNGVGTETFESFTSGQNMPITVNFGYATATLAGSGQIASVAQGSTNGVGRYAISGTKFVEAGSSAGAFDLTFSTPQAAFGFYGVDIGDYNGQLVLHLSNGSSSSITVPNSKSVPGGGVLYFGFFTDSADEFTGVSFRNTNPGGGDYFAFDSFSIGTIEQVNPNPVVPLPAAAWSGLSLLGGLGIVRRFRRA